MKLVILWALLAVMVVLPQSAYTDETEVLRIFDHKYHPSNEEMKDHLDKAKLEHHGFTRTVETTRKIDQKGKITVKKTIHYKVIDHCSKVGKWEKVLAERLPKGWTKWFKKTEKEVKRRIAGKKTKQCEIGVEIHPQRGCGKEKSITNGRKKRGFCIGICWYSSTVEIRR
ncbi:uncharacterized protein LOC124442956 [Xenia sp. Carnegie-2017]|uniref:uncharacterized protein LOC124442955 n=1 Tax=Xenia sp. Carnegie-2017 TaxID=2897299 RepID=UPI001F03B024|nr:uncharacterized protein LOC124442955 [Xenia sp. Carnegie-2017]XP_046849435.1 uncharacterized protein LOC124442956 [Xenia sp. Carnegie-2017]